MSNKTEGNHTPGPWKIHDRGIHQNRYLAVVDSIPDKDGKVVANCICHVSMTNPDADANARLIKMAPQMLEDLILVLDTLDTNKKREPKSDAILMMAIVDTIEQATGKKV